MYSRTVTVTAPQGIHARTAAEFVKVAAEYRSDIWMEKDSSRLSGKSLLGILSLGVNCGDEITIIANGPDERAAVEGLAAVINNPEQ